MFSIIIGLFFSFILITSQEMRLIAKAIETFRPCANGILTMERLLDGPPSKENYWDGILNVERLYPNITEATFMLQLDAPANITVNPKEGRVITHKNSFDIYYFKQNHGFKKLKFHVEGVPFGKFPNIGKILLNYENVCLNPSEWNPTKLVPNMKTASNK